MGACDRDFGLVWLCAAEVAYSARGQGSRLGVDEEFRNRAFAEPAGIVPGDRDHVGRGACDRDLAGRNRQKNAAIAAPIYAGLSSWMKWAPATVISVWFGYVRQKSRIRPVVKDPGSALMKSFGIGLSLSQPA